MKKIMCLLLGALLVLSMTGCGESTNQSAISQSAKIPDKDDSQSNTANGNNDVPKAKEEPVLKIGTTGKHTSFSLFIQGGAYGKLNLQKFGQEPLFGHDEEGNITPGFFQTFTINDANDEIVFTFPTDARFHDGTTITMDDVLFTMESWQDKWKGRGYNLTTEVVSDNSIRCTFAEPNAYSYLSYSAGQCYIAPKHIWENVEDVSKYDGDDAHIGAGPYRFVKYDEDADISYYEAFEDYYGDPVTIKKVELHSYANHESLAMAIKTGEVDTMSNYASPIPATLIGVLKDADNVDLGKSRYTGNYQLTFGFNMEPTRDLNFREAVYYALDYDLLAMSIGKEDATPAKRGMIPPGNKGYVDTYEENKQDLAKAAAFLDEAGYVDIDKDGYREMPDGSALDVSILPQSSSSIGETLKRIGEIAKNNLDQIGVKTHFDEEAMRNEDIFNSKTKGNGTDQTYELYVGYTTPGVADYRTSAFYVMPEPFYQSGTFTDEEYVAAYKDLQAARDRDAYEDAVAKLQAINAKKLPLICVAWETCYFPYRTDKFEGWENWISNGVINEDTWFTIRPCGAE